MEFMLSQIEDWIIDLKDQTAEVSDIERLTKELYEVMYEFETIGQHMQKVLEYIDKAQEVRL
jgi:Na+/phosphate symporter